MKSSNRYWATKSDWYRVNHAKNLWDALRKLAGRADAILGVLMGM